MAKPETSPELTIESYTPAPTRRWGYQQLAWALALLGAGIRVEQYLHNRSLWLDEAMVGLNLIHRTFGQLTQPLEFHVVEPIAWLFTAKVCNLLFGAGEKALRFPVLAAGVIAVALVLLLGRRLLSPAALCVAVGWFALSRPLIYYSSELKPYGSDPAVAALLWLTALWTLGRPNGRRLAVLGLWGALAIWYSHPAVFVLAGLGLTILWWTLSEGGWRKLAGWTPVLFAWMFSFAVNYWLFLRSSSHDPMLLNNYQPLRLSLWHFEDVEKPLEMIFALQQTPFTILLGVAVFAFCVGCAYYWRRNRVVFSLLLTPLLFALLASSLHLYPAVGRFYNFFTPAMALLIAAGAEALMELGREKRTAVAAVLVTLLFVQPVLSAREVIAHPMEAEELRPVLSYVLSQQQAGDTWYLYWHTQVAYRYYAEVDGLRGSNVILSTPFDGVHRGVFAQDAARLRGRRVWVVISNPGRLGGVDEFSLLVQAFDAAGVRRETYWRTGAVAFLYEMKP